MKINMDMDDECVDAIVISALKRSRASLRNDLKGTLAKNGDEEELIDACTKIIKYYSP